MTNTSNAASALRPPDKVTILAVHGNGGGSSRFMLLPEFMPSGAELVAIDLPGFEGSPLRTDFTRLEHYADHLAELVEEHRVAGQPIIVLGTGIGGSIALDLASRRPELMDGLILHAIVGASLDTRLFPRLMKSKPVRGIIRRGISAKLARPILTKIFFSTGAPAPVLDRFFDGYRTCAAFSDMFDLINVDWFDSVAPIEDLPVSLIWGEHDRVLKSHQAELIKAKAPNGGVTIQPGWDHFPMLEQPEEYAHVIVDHADALVAQARA